MSPELPINSDGKIPGSGNHGSKETVLCTQQLCKCVVPVTSLANQYCYPIDIIHYEDTNIYILSKPYLKKQTNKQILHDYSQHVKPDGQSELPNNISVVQFFSEFFM